MKYFLILLLAFGMMINVSCSSNTEEGDGGLSTEASEELTEESADAMSDAFLDEDMGSDVSDSGSESSEDMDLLGEEEAQADLGEDSLDEFSTDENVAGSMDEFADLDMGGEGDELDLDSASSMSEPTDDLVMMDEAPAPSDELASGDMSSGIDTPMEDSSMGFSPGETVAEEPAPVVEAESFDSVTSFEEPVQKPSWVPVQKIKSIPFTKNSRLMNTVYILRSGDQPEEVSSKIYGSADTQQMYSDNPHLMKSFKQGDKLYYNSPNRPADSSRILTYYEDMGIPSKTYFARSGENIRKISSDLIGGSGAWKEVYATNQGIESKGDLYQDAEIVYWPKSSGSEIAAPTMNVADNSMNMPPEFEEPVAVPPAMPMPVDMGSDNNMNAGAVAGSVGELTPPPAPPAPPVEMTPPPAPPVDVAMNNPQPNFAQERAAQRSRVKKQKETSDDDLMITLGAVLIAAGGALFLIMKKSRAKKMKMDITEQTQI